MNIDQQTAAMAPPAVFYSPQKQNSVGRQAEELRLQKKQSSKLLFVSPMVGCKKPVDQKSPWEWDGVTTNESNKFAQGDLDDYIVRSPHQLFFEDSPEFLKGRAEEDESMGPDRFTLCKKALFESPIKDWKASPHGKEAANHFLDEDLSMSDESEVFEGTDEDAAKSFCSSDFEFAGYWHI